MDHVVTTRASTSKAIVAGVLIGAILIAANVAHAGQIARPAEVAVDSVIDIDHTQGLNGDSSTGVVMDTVLSVGLGSGFEGIVRPYMQRLPSGEWNRQIWVAAVRYQRPGPVALRVDAGLIPSPIGLANLMLRPQLNPLIALPVSLFQSLPPTEIGGPRATLLGAVYAYGADATLSGTHWDARAAVIDTSPVRTRRVFAQTNPPRFNNVVVGGGYSPFVGMRIGASVTHGDWQRAGESPTITETRQATIVTVESEWSFRYTRLLGEWVHDTLETSLGDVTPQGWFVQGQQTLTPRWFAAARVERMSAPARTTLLPPVTLVDQRLNAFEETIGFRLTPELTFRAEHRARRTFGRDDFDQQIAVSAVWWKRWR